MTSSTNTDQQRPTMLFVTTADTDILTAERALSGLPDEFPQVVAFNPINLADSDAQESLLLAVEHAGVAVLRLLGGKRALPDLFDPLVRACQARGVPLIACPGHQEWDEDLVTACSVPVAEVETVFAYLMRGGVQNLQNLFLFLSDTYFDSSYGHDAPTHLPWEGLYHPDVAEGTGLDDYMRMRFADGKPNVAVLFYRAHWMSGNLQAIDSLVRRLEGLGANVLPIFSYSLKHNPEGDGQANRTFTEFLAGPDGTPRVDCIINTMGMSMSELSTEGATIAAGWSVDYLDQLDVPMLQGIVSTGTQEEWDESSLGLGPIDTAMSVALPEFDGRIISVPISFKQETAAAQGGKLAGRLQRYVAHEDRVDYLARLAIKWAKLRVKPNSEKRIAIILSNYPTKDARIGNAVGLDTPASVIRILHELESAGYYVNDIPENGDELVHRIIERCSNDRDYLTEEQLRMAAGHVTGRQYAEWFQDFPFSVSAEITEAWGDPPGQVYRSNGSLAIAGIDLGNVFVGLQPPRGFGENPISVYHSPDLAPTHHYIAYYRWISDVFQADAMIHVGKHGTLGVAAGQGHRPFGGLLSRSGPSGPAAVLSFHHQQSR